MPLKIIYYAQLVVVKVLKLIAAAALTIVLSFVVILWNMREQDINVTPFMMENQRRTGVVPRQHWVPLDSISPEVIKAVIACEDNNFFYHFGFDIEAIKEAMQRNQSGKKIYGASTITQQMVKNVFLSHQRTWVRKAAELVLSLIVELMWGKARIMEVYLNVIEMGANVYGIEAAAQYYFRKHAIELDRREAVLIALSLPAPRKYNPTRPGRYMNQRYEQICEIMDKLMKFGWYKDIKNIKQIKVNYLENYPSPPRSIKDDSRDGETTNSEEQELPQDSMFLDENENPMDEDSTTTSELDE